MIELTGFEYFKAWLARQMILLAAKISPLSTLALCLEVGRKYMVTLGENAIEGGDD